MHTRPPDHPERDRGSVKAFAAGGVVVGVVLVLVSWTGLGLLRNPFASETVDRSPPPILTELRDLADFHAAQAQFEVVIDEEEDVNLLPQFIAGERVQYVAVGSVDAVVDFSGLTDASIAVDAETMTVTLSLPAPTLQDPVIDMELSHVMNRDRGIVDRVSGLFSDNPTSEQALVLAAEDKMAASARRTDLVARAKTNTTNMLSGMLGALGYETVQVRYESSGSTATD